MKRSWLLPALFCTLPAHALEALDEFALREQDAQAGLSLGIVWRVNADTAGNPLGGTVNSLPLQSTGQNEYLILHGNSGKFVASKIDLDLVSTPVAVGPVKPALKVTLPGALEYTRWRIDEISIGTTADAPPGQNGKIVGFETNAVFRFGATTAAYLFNYTPP